MCSNLRNFLNDMCFQAKRLVIDFSFDESVMEEMH